MDTEQHKIQVSLLCSIPSTDKLVEVYKRSAFIVFVPIAVSMEGRYLVRLNGYSIKLFILATFLVSSKIHHVIQKLQELNFKNYIICMIIGLFFII